MAQEHPLSKNMACYCVKKNGRGFLGVFVGFRLPAFSRLLSVFFNLPPVQAEYFSMGQEKWWILISAEPLVKIKISLLAA